MYESADQKLSKGVIAVDIDGVIADCMTPLMESYERLHGYNPGLPTTWELADSWDVDNDKEIWADFAENGGYTQCKVYEGAKDFLSDLKFAGYNVILITARGTGSDPVVKHGIASPRACRAENYNWLTLNEIPFDRLHHSDTKIGYRYNLLVDDNPTIIKNVIASNKLGICFWREWNKKEIQKLVMPTADSWQDIMAMILTHQP